MRILLPLSAVAVLLVVGCQTRDSVTVTPDRQNHARTSEGPKTVGIAAGPVARADEQWYTVVAGDTLISVSKKFNTTVEKLIDRNILKSNKLTVGQNIIVNKPGASPR